MSSRRVLVVYGIIVFVFAVLVANRPDYFGNVAFLVVGALIGVYPAFIIDEIKRKERSQRVREAIFYELANRVAKCCFDFESPWHAYLTSPVQKTPFDARKFSPVPPIIYPAVAAEISLLGRDAQKVIEFYIFLDSWRRDLENRASSIPPTSINGMIPAPEISRLSARLRQAVEFGGIALRQLSSGVPNAEQIMLDAIAEADRLVPDAHPNKGMHLLERIRLILEK